MRLASFSSLALPFALAVSTVSAKYICDKNSLKGLYPFCVNMPDKIPEDNCQGRMPTILYLGGSGTLGDRKDVETLSTYDGFGKLLANYRAGNTSEVVKLAAERFIAIIPIAPLQSPFNTSNPDNHYRVDFLDKVLNLAKKKYPIDDKRIYVVGYSMGSRGAWRYNVFRPDVAAAAVNIAGGAEKADGEYIKQEPAPPTFHLLYRLKNLSIRAYAGTLDTTAGNKIPKATQDELVRTGSHCSSLTILKNTHEGLQAEPFTAELLNWLLQHRKGGQCRRLIKPKRQDHHHHHGQVGHFPSWHWWN